MGRTRLLVVALVALLAAQAAGPPVAAGGAVAREVGTGGRSAGDVAMTDERRLQDVEAAAWRGVVTRVTTEQRTQNHGYGITTRVSGRTVESWGPTSVRRSHETHQTGRVIFSATWSMTRTRTQLTTYPPCWNGRPRYSKLIEQAQARRAGVHLDLTWNTLVRYQVVSTANVYVQVTRASEWSDCTGGGTRTEQRRDAIGSGAMKGRIGPSRPTVFEGRVVERRGDRTMTSTWRLTSDEPPPRCEPGRAELSDEQRAERMPGRAPEGPTAEVGAAAPTSLSESPRPLGAGAPVQVTVTPGPILESGGTTGNVSYVSVVNPNPFPLTGPVMLELRTARKTAKPYEDYLPEMPLYIHPALLIPPGASVGTVRFVPLDDLVDEPNEKFEVTVLPRSIGTLVLTRRFEATIVDDDRPACPRNH